MTNSQQDTTKIRVLVSNDDGVFSPGIKALAQSLTEIADVAVAAPDVEQSAVGHGITIRRPLRFKHTAAAGFGDIPAYRVDGTPTDCVVLGTRILQKPDVVVSGINLGYNLGNDLTHSGTVAAALEGMILGIHSIAFSQAANEQGEYNFEHAKAYIPRIVQWVYERGLPPRTLINVNFPPVKPRGVKITFLSDYKFEDELVKRQDPDGRDYYWVAGTPKSTIFEEGSDEWAVREGYVSITPVRFDLSHREFMTQMEDLAE
ncbi:5'/3'-nucleotidase SurE [Deinococcus cellulosilyticus]|uniref:5'-nucleotidase SurE n=1 Tax=Deinococcus cellulosilyticus (strain DSM 18568 / NBRC 106333 / KACC 11606 / 5516J-15) TaxID=1223518 RepID=A0A511NB36_DEIC1|nr:5'/3'-nucleotidase SurE [Deinococcus cellulosilyticus]GEM50012.1 5'-nucleotidase SurE [Deinococcus cellulosilyticus NBRC 106333 = KACC 11606]